MPGIYDHRRHSYGSRASVPHGDRHGSTSSLEHSTDEDVTQHQYHPGDGKTRHLSSASSNDNLRSPGGRSSGSEFVPPSRASTLKTSQPVVDPMQFVKASGNPLKSQAKEVVNIMSKQKDQKKQWTDDDWQSIKPEDDAWMQDLSSWKSKMRRKSAASCTRALEMEEVQKQEEEDEMNKKIKDNKTRENRRSAVAAYPLGDEDEDDVFSSPLKDSTNRQNTDRGGANRPATDRGGANRPADQPKHTWDRANSQNDPPKKTWGGAKSQEEEPRKQTWKSKDTGSDNFGKADDRPQWKKKLEELRSHSIEEKGNASQSDSSERTPRSMKRAHEFKAKLNMFQSQPEECPSKTRFDQPAVGKIADRSPFLQPEDSENGGSSVSQNGRSQDKPRLPYVVTGRSDEKPVEIKPLASGKPGPMEDQPTETKPLSYRKPATEILAPRPWQKPVENTFQGQADDKAKIPQWNSVGPFQAPKQVKQEADINRNIRDYEDGESDTGKQVNGSESREFLEKVIKITQNPTSSTKGFGFSIRGGREDQQPITVDKVNLGSAADVCELLSGDELVAVNGAEVASHFLESVRLVISQAARSGSIELRVRRSLSQDPTFMEDSFEREEEELRQSQNFQQLADTPPPTPGNHQNIISAYTSTPSHSTPPVPVKCDDAGPPPLPSAPPPSWSNTKRLIAEDNLSLLDSTDILPDPSADEPPSPVKTHRSASIDELDDTTRQKIEVIRQRSLFLGVDYQTTQEYQKIKEEAAKDKEEQQRAALNDHFSKSLYGYRSHDLDYDEWRPSREDDIEDQVDNKNSTADQCQKQNATNQRTQSPVLGFKYSQSFLDEERQRMKEWNEKQEKLRQDDSQSHQQEEYELERKDLWKQHQRDMERVKQIEEEKQLKEQQLLEKERKWKEEMEKERKRLEEDRRTMEEDKRRLLKSEEERRRNEERRKFDIERNQPPWTTVPDTDRFRRKEMEVAAAKEREWLEAQKREKKEKEEQERRRREEMERIKREKQMEEERRRERAQQEEKLRRAQMEEEEHRRRLQQVEAEIREKEEQEKAMAERMFRNAYSQSQTVVAPRSTMVPSSLAARAVPAAQHAATVRQEPVHMRHDPVQIRQEPVQFRAGADARPVPEPVQINRPPIRPNQGRESSVESTGSSGRGGGVGGGGGPRSKMPIQPRASVKAEIQQDAVPILHSVSRTNEPSRAMDRDSLLKINQAPRPKVTENWIKKDSELNPRRSSTMARHSGSGPHWVLEEAERRRLAERDGRERLLKLQSKQQEQVMELAGVYRAPDLAATDQPVLKVITNADFPPMHAKHSSWDEPKVGHGGEHYAGNSVDNIFYRSQPAAPAPRPLPESVKQTLLERVNGRADPVPVAHYTHEYPDSPRSAGSYPMNRSSTLTAGGQIPSANGRGTEVLVRSGTLPVQGSSSLVQPKSSSLPPAGPVAIAVQHLQADQYDPNNSLSFVQYPAQGQSASAANQLPSQRTQITTPQYQYPQQGGPQNQYPQQGAPQNQYPQQGGPQNQYPQQGVPQNQYPAQPVHSNRLPPAQSGPPAPLTSTVSPPSPLYAYPNRGRPASQLITDNYVNFPPVTRPLSADMGSGLSYSSVQQAYSEAMSTFGKGAYESAPDKPPRSESTHLNTNYNNSYVQTQRYSLPLHVNTLPQGGLLGSAQMSPASSAEVPPPVPPKSAQLQSELQKGVSEDLIEVQGNQQCAHCRQPLGQGAAMMIEALHLYYHLTCFRCCVCYVPLGTGQQGADVRVRQNRLHCQNCYSNEEAGLKYSRV